MFNQERARDGLRIVQAELKIAQTFLGELAALEADPMARQDRGLLLAIREILRIVRPIEALRRQAVRGAEVEKRRLESDIRQSKAQHKKQVKFSTTLRKFEISVEQARKSL